MPVKKIPVKAYVSLLGNYLQPYRKSMIGLASLLLVMIVLQLVNPQIIRYFIDTAQNADSGKNLYIAAVFFIGVSLLQQILTVTATYIGENIGWKATNKLRGDVAEHCLKLDMSFHKTHTTGAVIERVDGDVNNLTTFFSSFIILLLSNMLLLAGILVLLFREGWLIGTVMTLFVLLAIYTVERIRRFTTPYTSKLRQISAEFFGFLGEHLEGTEDTRANGATGYVMRRFYYMLRNWFPVRIKAFYSWGAMWTSTLLIFGLGNTAAFGISAYAWRHGLITMGTVYMIFYYTELMVKPIENIRIQLQDLQKAEASIVRIRQLLETESAIKDEGMGRLPEGSLDVQLDRVVFGYEEESTALNEVSFSLREGEILGVLGRTGSGKTSLTRLLLRFYDQRSGSIRIGGEETRNVPVAELRQKVGLVTQNIELFQGTVRDNLTFYDESIADAQIVEVLNSLGLKGWLGSLPRGLDTELDSGGGGLSAGEAQLLSFARVFLSNPGLVILDEASSRLDPVTEQKIESAIGRLLQGRTCIIIAHRLATIQRADRILVLENGTVAEFAERQRLAADPQSRFSRMLEVGLEEVTV
ncbi:ABC transporter ATP-binding protein [Gorillibacterium massiliense]|uniref:ABC transporter ATP-binding protein n=1 Tax=Gorillibacterium massiliense TaxID=1280390 RepID=UPI0004B5BA5D|nr:ABC transporter ATP-binding protein [Gorillibacterium massiliense]